MNVVSDDDDHYNVCVLVCDSEPDGVYGPVYGSDIYATVGRPRRQFWSPSTVTPPSMLAPRSGALSPVDSRLSTNV